MKIYKYTIILALVLVMLPVDTANGQKVFYSICLGFNPGGTTKQKQQQRSLSEQKGFFYFEKYV